ncbi:hypothetical protein FDD32_07370 [Neisseria gonorrhoeae]
MRRPSQNAKQTNAKQASKQASKQKIITPLPADARTFRAAYSPFPAPQTRLFFRQGFSPPPFPVFLPSTRVRAPAAPCRAFAPGRHRSAIRFSVSNTPVSERNADVSTHRTTYKVPPYVSS